MGNTQKEQVSMRCPYCMTAFSAGYTRAAIVSSDGIGKSGEGYSIMYTNCPECRQLIMELFTGEVTRTMGGVDFESKGRKFIVPQYYARPVEQEVPQKIKEEYQEAASVLSVSPKSSAALSRRLLQLILREHFAIIKTDLAREIDEFISRTDTPSYLKESLDAIRNVGNFAAHPLKNTNTGEIVDVEPGEAGYLLDVMDLLFDFAFVQPERMKAKRDALNAKLQSIGKPPIKTA